mmetsp:Transcript_161038/g.309410  ORF Transcript_161038/g.309410 Transcript_161038/m.309410 type:complete len:358 (-) Transcript_161038:42-1115(-)
MQPVGYVAIARHSGGKCTMAKTWELTDKSKSMSNYFVELPGRLYVTGDGSPNDQHIHADLPGAAEGLAYDPIFGGDGGLAFNWQYSNNGVRIAVPGAYKNPYKLPGRFESNDDLHGLGNELGARTVQGHGSKVWWHDVGQKQGVCHRAQCRVLGTDHGTGLSNGPSWSDAQYAIYVSTSATKFECQGRTLKQEMSPEKVVVVTDNSTLVQAGASKLQDAAKTTSSPPAVPQTTSSPDMFQKKAGGPNSDFEAAMTVWLTLLAAGYLVMFHAFCILQISEGAEFVAMCVRCTWTWSAINVMVWLALKVFMETMRFPTFYVNVEFLISLLFAVVANICSLITERAAKPEYYFRNSSIAA